LIEAGVEVTALRVPATHHDFAMLNALADTPATIATIALASQKLADAIGTRTREQEAA
jgi:acetyl esterase/lipase